MKIKNISLILLSSLFLTAGCKDLFEPELQNNREQSNAYTDPIFAQGILINGYVRIPTNGWIWSDMATDNAVSRDETNAFYRMAQGEWADNNNPLAMWSQCYLGIQFMNIVLDITDKVEYTRNETTNILFQDRAKGEAHGLRALLMYHLLQNHAGIEAGRLMGVPIFTDVQNSETDFNLPRATFAECLQFIYDDVQKATEYLPDEYFDRTNESQLPEKYRQLNVPIGEYNRAFGNASKQLMDGKIARAVRAHASLLAASPAFSQSGVTWEKAADDIADLLNRNGGLSGIDPNGLNWYTAAVINALTQGQNPKEILWRGGFEDNRTLETENRPPTVDGQGRINPTQNLVDAFPMITGFPINDPQNRGGYNPNNPYANRDPRLAKFILYNGGVSGVNDATTIYTSVDGGTNDGLGRSQNATRTRYYMKKLLRTDVNLNPTSANTQRHIKPRMRYTDFYLGYAEAANEAWGPTGTGTHGYSAYDVVKAIRIRAGIGLTNNDPYLEEAKNDKSLMSQLIRNERRLELCFEGYRFWDLRRWDANLNETAKGIRIEGTQYTVFDVQPRSFENFMIYGPIPYGETLKYPLLKQNDGW